MNFPIYFQCIQITATTPTSNAVRLETGSIELELSNRVQTATMDSAVNKHTLPKLFVKMQVKIDTKMLEIFLIIISCT